MDNRSDSHNPAAAFAARNTPPDARRWKQDGRRDYRAEWRDMPYGAKVVIWLTVAILIVGTVWPFLTAP